MSSFCDLATDSDLVHGSHRSWHTFFKDFWGTFSRSFQGLFFVLSNTNTSWVALVTPTDRPRSVRNRCLIELFCGVVCVVTCPFDISVGVGAFVIGLGQISSFLSFKYPFAKKLSTMDFSNNYTETILSWVRQKNVCVCVGGGGGGGVGYMF